MKPDDEINVKHKDFEENLEMQEALTPVVLGNLLDFGMEEGQQLRVYFFYTDTLDKADALATELKKLGYMSGPEIPLMTKLYSSSMVGLLK